jgi:hypothetical protein
MNCASCQDALLGLAAVNSEPSAELHAHLQLCAACSAIFERERHLFADIDAGLQASANSTLPSSFFPGLRVRINAPVAPFRKPVSVRGVILVAAAAAILALSIVRQQHRTPGQPAGVTPGGRQSAPEAAMSPVELEQPNVDSPLQPRPGVAPPERNARAENRRQPPPISTSATEIIVPADQEVLLARYAEQLSHRRKAPARMSDDALSAATKPLEVDLIQIAQLDVKPLADRPE